MADSEYVWNGSGRCEGIHDPDVHQQNEIVDTKFITECPDCEKANKKLHITLQKPPIRAWDNAQQASSYAAVHSPGKRHKNAKVYIVNTMRMDGHKHKFDVTNVTLRNYL